MKFILGYIHGTKSVYYDGPEVITRLVAEHDGVRYEFDRWERNEAGIFQAKLAVYDSDDYPPGLITNLIKIKQIVPSDPAQRTGIMA